MTTTTTGLRAALKAETAAVHARLEDALDLLGPSMDRDAYRRVLERFYGYYAALEPVLAEAGASTGMAGAERAKAPRLAADLAALGLTEAAIAALPRCAALPALDSPGAAWGCLYVVEGSTLGGQLMARHYGQTLGVTPEAGCSFFSGYGRETGARWGAFVTALDAHDTAEVRAQAPAAALDTFHTLARWMTASEA
jgi:heme oxygenase